MSRILKEGPTPSVVLKTGPPHEGALILRVDRLYDPVRLRRAIRRGKEPDAAAIWRLDGPHGLAGAEDELIRRTTYQPIGKFWSLGPAKLLARALAPTRIRPNGVTLAATAFMLLAAGFVATGWFELWVRVVTAVAMAVGLVLDTADGHLARLQGTASRFGKWLDAVLDECADMALHVAIAWACYSRSGVVGWLLLGMAYVMGKHLFMQSNTEWDQSGGEEAGSRSQGHAVSVRGGWWTRLVRGLGHADLRWHAWIVLAALGRLDLGLIFYSVYYPARLGMGVLSKWRA